MPPATLRAALTWALLLAVLAPPVVAAGFSPFLAWRQPVYIIAGFAGIVAMALLPLQPLLALGILPGMGAAQARRAHRRVGGALVAAVLVHVAGLWITSPPDVIDALTFTSPTLFTPFGVVAMWAVFATAALALARRRRRIPWRRWRAAHLALAVVIGGGTVVHALLIEGTMEILSKWMLSGFVLAALALAILPARGSRPS